MRSALTLCVALCVFCSPCCAAFRPRFIGEPQDVLVEEGKSFSETLTCTPAAAKDVVDVVWQFGLQRVDRFRGLTPTRRQNDSWVLRLEYRTDSLVPLLGEYACVVDYGIFGALKSRVANVRSFGQQNVRLLGPKAELQIAEQNTAILRCSTIFGSVFQHSGLVTVRTKWFRSDARNAGATPLQSGGRDNVVVLPSGSLLFPSAQLRDAGNYFCNAEVRFRSTSFTRVSKSAQLVVERSMRNASCSPQPYDGPCTNGDLYYYNSLTFRCQAYLARQCKLEASDNFFRDVHSCEAACGAPRSVYELSVYAEQQTVVEFVGRDVSLECYATGLPRPRVRWSQDGRVLGGNVDGNLLLRAVRTTSSGRYSCDAQNRFQADGRTINLVVLNALAVSFRLSVNSVVITRYEHARVTCSVDDFLPDSVIRFVARSTFEWFLGNRPAPYAVLSSSAFHSEVNVTGEHFGILQCRAYRASTNEHQQGALFVSPKPPTPKRLYVMNTLHSSAVLLWQLENTRPGVPIKAIEVVWHKNDNGVPSYHTRHLRRDARSLQLTSLEQDTTYVVEIRTINEFEIGDRVTKMIRTARIKPSHPRHVLVEVLNASAVMVSWQQPKASRPPIAVDGYIMRYVPLGRRTAWKFVDVPRRPTPGDNGRTETVVAGLQPLTQYAWVIHAYTVSADYRGNGSAQAYGTTSWSNLYTAVVNSTTVRMSWNSLPQHWPATGLRIFGQEVTGNRSGDWFRLHAEPRLSPSSVLYLAATLKPAKTYRFRAAVDGVDGLLNETRTGEVTTTPESPSPLRFLAFSASSRSVQLTWDFPTAAPRLDARLGRVEAVQYRIVNSGSQTPLPWQSVSYSTHRTGVLVQQLAVERSYIFLARCVTARGGFGPALLATAATARYCRPPTALAVEQVSDVGLRVKWSHTSLGDYCTAQSFAVRVFHHPSVLGSGRGGVAATPRQAFQVDGKRREAVIGDLVQGYHYVVEVEATATTETQYYRSLPSNITFFTRIRDPTPAPQHLSVRYATGSGDSKSDKLPEIRWWMPEPSVLYRPFLVKIRFMRAGEPLLVFREATVNVSGQTPQQRVTYSPMLATADSILFDMRIMYAKKANGIVPLDSSKAAGDVAAGPLRSVSSAILTGRRRRRRDTTVSDLLVYSKYTEAVLLHTPYGDCCQREAGSEGADDVDGNALLSSPLHVTARASGPGSVVVRWHAPHQRHDDVVAYVIYVWSPSDTGARAMQRTVVGGDDKRAATLPGASLEPGKIYAYRMTAEGALGGESAMSHRAFLFVGDDDAAAAAGGADGVGVTTGVKTGNGDGGPDTTGTTSPGNSSVVAALVACFVTLLIILMLAVLVVLYRRRARSDSKELSGGDEARARGGSATAAAAAQKGGVRSSEAPTPVMWSDSPAPPYSPAPADDVCYDKRCDGGTAFLPPVRVIAAAAAAPVPARHRPTRSQSSSGVSSDDDDSIDARPNAAARNIRGSAHSGAADVMPVTRQRSNSLSQVELQAVRPAAAVPSAEPRDDIAIASSSHGAAASRRSDCHARVTVKRTHSLGNTNSTATSARPEAFRRQRSRPSSPPPGAPPAPPSHAIADAPVKTTLHATKSTPTGIAAVTSLPPQQAPPALPLPAEPQQQHATTAPPPPSSSGQRAPAKVTSPAPPPSRPMSQPSAHARSVDDRDSMGVAASQAAAAVEDGGQRRILARCASDGLASGPVPGQLPAPPQANRTSTMPRFRPPPPASALATCRAPAAATRVVGTASPDAISPYSQTSLMAGVTRIETKAPQPSDPDYDEPVASAHAAAVSSSPQQKTRLRSASMGNERRVNHYAAVHLTAGGELVPAEEDRSSAPNLNAFIDELDAEDACDPGYSRTDEVVADKRRDMATSSLNMPEHYQNVPLTRDQHIYRQVNQASRRKNSESHYATIDLAVPAVGQAGASSPPPEPAEVTHYATVMLKPSGDTSA